MNNNKTTKREYSATQTNSISCYTDLEGYGSIPGLRSMIVPPTPVTVVPAAGNLMRPYKMPNLNPRSFNCVGYKEMNNIDKTNPNSNCEYYSAFRSGFNDVSGYR